MKSFLRTVMNNLLMLTTNYAAVRNQDSIVVAVGEGSFTSAASADGSNFYSYGRGNPFPGLKGNAIIWNSNYSNWYAVGGIRTNTQSVAISKNGFRWTYPINPAGNPFNDGGFGIAWNYTDLYFCAVGQKRTNGINTESIAISPDGSNWSYSVNNPFYEGTGFGIAWNGNYWCAVGYSGIGGSKRAAISTNGTNWTPSTDDPFAGGIGYGIAWNYTDLYWCAVGYGYLPTSTGTISISENGYDWNTISQDPFSGKAYGIAWNGTYWCAVGYGGKSAAISTNGMSWTPSIDDPFPEGQGNSITWDYNTLNWYAVGNSFDGTKTFARSPDGLYWTSSNIFNGNTGGLGIASKSISPISIPVNAIAVGNNSDNTVTIARSSDGLSWIPSGNPFPGGVANGIAYNGSNLWVAVGNNNNNTVCIATSVNGGRWTNAINQPFTGIGANARGTAIGIAYGCNMWCAVGYNSSQTVHFAISSNGYNWSIPANNPFNGGLGINVLYNGSNLWVAVGQNGTPGTGKSTVTSAYSRNGSNWFSAVNSIYTEQAALGVAYNGSNLWVSVGEGVGGTKNGAYSPNGSNWFTPNNQPFGNNGGGRAVAYNGSYWCAVGINRVNNCISAISTTGVSWDIGLNNPFTPGSATGITWNNNKWYAVGRNSTGSVTTATSPDGLTWTASTNPFPGGGGNGIKFKNSIY